MVRHLVLVLSLVLLGCDGKSPTEPRPFPTTTPAPVVAATPSPTPAPTDAAPYLVDISGTVLSCGRPVVGALVTLRRVPAGFTYIVPVRDGAWHCQVFSGDFSVAVQAPGYQTLVAVVGINRTSTWFPFELYPTDGGAR